MNQNGGATTASLSLENLLAYQRANFSIKREPEARDAAAMTVFPPLGHHLHQDRGQAATPAGYPGYLLHHHQGEADSLLQQEHNSLLNKL